MKKLTINKLIESTIKLGEKWKIDKVEFNDYAEGEFEEGEVHVYISWNKNFKMLCPHCGKENVTIENYYERTFRHLRFFQHKTFLHVKMPRVRCTSENMSYQIIFDLVDENNQSTILFDKWVVLLAKSMSLQTVTNYVNASRTMVERAFNSACAKKDEMLDFSNIKGIAIDETSKGKNHDYVSMVCDHETKKPIGLYEKNTSEVVKEFKTDFKSHNGKVTHILNVSSDMFGGFRKGFELYLPWVKKNIDKFHVIKNINSAMDEVRRTEFLKNYAIKKNRFLLFKNTSNLNKEEELKLQTILQDSSETTKAYNLKTSFENFYLCKDKETAKNFFAVWNEKVNESLLKPMIRIAKSLKKHIHSILNWFDTKITNAVCEGQNCNLQMIKTRCRGIRKTLTLKHMLFLTCGTYDVFCSKIKQKIKESKFIK